MAAEAPGIATPLNLYQYAPVNQEEQSIRILTLQPGLLSSKVFVKLREQRFPFPPEEDVKFEALSYTWGSSHDPRKIYVDDDENNSCYVLRITKNLAEALDHLRYEDKPRVLWIDAICVDQEDLLERNYHVGRMAHIYPHAERVIVWIGKESKDSDLAFELMRPLKSKIEIDWASTTMSSALDDPSEANWADWRISLPFDGIQFLAIHHLISRSWFERLWVWQEVRLASIALIQCGKNTLDWENFRSAVFLLFTKILPPHAPDGLRKRVETAYRLCGRYGFLSFRRLLEFTKHSKCTDDRDRVFAILSLIEAPEYDFGVQADYTKTAYEAYKDAVLKYAINCKKLDLFTTIDTTARQFEGKASWVPDWSKPRHSSCFGFSFASADTRAVAIHLDEGRLQLTGVYVSTVSEVEQFSLLLHSDLLLPHEVLLALNKMITRFGLRQELLQDEQQRRNFCRVICADWFGERYEPFNIGFPKFDACVAALYRILAESDFDKATFTTEEELFLRTAGRFCQARCFFTTLKGTYGLAPRNAQAGDVIAVFLGCSSAMLLRPAPDSSSYILIGEVNPTGTLDGEVILGSLPGAYETTLNLAVRWSAYWWVFIDRETGKFTPKDPRLGDLSPVWNRKAHEDDHVWTWFVNKETGEELKRGLDPRKTLEALRDRGLELRQFVLI